MADGRWQKTAAGSLTAPYGYMETRLNIPEALAFQTSGLISTHPVLMKILKKC